MPVTAVIAEAIRTPFGGHDSPLAQWHAVDLLALTMRAALERSPFAIDQIDEVVVGCANPVGEQALNIARNAVLANEWPESLTASTVDAQGASGVVALAGAVAKVKSGAASVCLVAAVASTRVPDGASTGVAVGKPFGPAVHARFEEAGGLRSPGIIAENIAKSMQITRKQLDAYAKASRDAAKKAQKSGEMKRELLSVPDKKKWSVSFDSDVLRDDSVFTELEPIFEKDGVLTAATFALPVSGAVALIVADAKAMPKHQQPLAILDDVHIAGAPVLSGDSGVDTALKALARSKRSANDVTFIDVVEDTAVTPLAFASSLPTEHVACNEDGGALAIGDPFGVSGLAAVARLAHRLDQHPQPAVALAVSAGSHALTTASVLHSTAKT